MPTSASAPPIVNAVYETDCHDYVAVRRVLAIDPLSDRVWWILLERRAKGEVDIPTPRRVVPELISLAALQSQLDDSVTRPADVDAFYVSLRPSAELSDAERAVRDTRWAFVKLIVEHDDEDPDQPERHDFDYLEPKARWSLIKWACRKTGVAHDRAYDYLRQYWIGGQTSAALTGGYRRSGALGVVRTPGAKKRGAPRDPKKRNPPPPDITPAMSDLLKKGGQRFIEREGMKPEEAYTATLETFFSREEEQPDGTLRRVLLPESELPNKRQFRYHYAKIRDPEKARIAAVGEREFNLTNRPAEGSSRHLSQGPGDLFFVDPTIADVYLVSELDPTRVIGRPILYLVVDHWSGNIVGFTVGLDGPSWLGVQLALCNAFSNKAAFCASLGHDLAQGEWDVEGLGRRLGFDRGAEFLGDASDQLTTFLQRTILNVPAFRADYKAIVENNFGIANEQTIHWQPGAVYEPRKRGGPDYRLDAMLTIRDFARLILFHVLWRNHKHQVRPDRVPSDYPLANDRLPVPDELWHWGIRNRTGFLRQLPAERIRIDLLPTYEARCTEEGVFVPDFKLRYTSSSPAIRRTLLRNSHAERPNVIVSADERDVSRVYLRWQGSTEVEELSLAGADAEYSGMTAYEALDRKKLLELARESGSYWDRQQLLDLHTAQASVFETARRRKFAALGPNGVPSTEGIREARAAEKRAEWKKDTTPAAPQESDAAIPIHRYIRPPR